MPFREDFIWGAATSSYQIEGGAFEDGRGLSVWDAFSHQPGKVFEGHTGDVSSDHYHRYFEDVDLLARMGINNYRFSVSWPRLLPEGTGTVNRKGVDFYNRLVDALLEKGIRPWMTLYHWDLPYALQARGGWENPDMPQWFEDYAKLCALSFGDRVRDFIPLNEPQCFIGMGCGSGVHAPGLVMGKHATVPMAHHVVKANGLSTQALRALVPGCSVGYAPNMNPCMPATKSEADIAAARAAYFHVPEGDDWHWNVSWWSDPVMLGEYPAQGLELLERFLPRGWEKDMPLIHQKLDYYGQNIYQGHVIRAADNARGWDEVPRPFGIAKTASQWPVTPEALYWGPRFLYERYQTPILITENGLSCHDALSLNGKVHDPNRENYVHRYLLNLRRAAGDGADIAGYFYWSLLDNFEWAEGYSDRFGLVFVDYTTGERTIKESAWWYKKVMESNGESL
ncbi:MAG: GH1 family beta-glucosidase [Eubacteriales bacterium]|nr:GH1 family beta-glucosidase [Eubacteriales bacterium]